MAATTKLLQLRPRTLPLATTAITPAPSVASVHFFSSSTTPDPDNAPSPLPNSQPPQPQSHSQSPSSFSAYFSDVKDGLKQQQSQRNLQSQPRRKPSSLSSAFSEQSDQIEEIRKNLLEFRQRSASPPQPPPSSTSSTTSAPNSSRPVSFQELYQRGLALKGQESAAPGTSDAAVKDSFSTIRDCLNQLKPSSTNQSQGGGRTNNAMHISRWKDSLTTRPLDPSSQSLQQRVYGGSDHLPLSLFGPEMKEEGEEDRTKIQMDFARSYSHRELGKKLKALRPERRDKKDWWSLEELSERQVKLRDIEEKEMNSMSSSIACSNLRQSLLLANAKDEPKKHKVDILGQLGRKPHYMSSPPKEELVEKYFHPDHMSAAEKLKLELRKVRDEFKVSESDWWANLTAAMIL